MQVGTPQKKAYNCAFPLYYYEDARQGLTTLAATGQQKPNRSFASFVQAAKESKLDNDNKSIGTYRINKGGQGEVYVLVISMGWSSL